MLYVTNLGVFIHHLGTVDTLYGWSVHSFARCLTVLSTLQTTKIQPYKEYKKSWGKLLQL